MTRNNPTQYVKITKTWTKIMSRIFFWGTTVYAEVDGVYCWRHPVAIYYWLAAGDSWRCASADHVLVRHGTDMRTRLAADATRLAHRVHSKQRRTSNQCTDHHCCWHSWRYASFIIHLNCILLVTFKQLCSYFRHEYLDSWFQIRKLFPI